MIAVIPVQLITVRHQGITYYFRDFPGQGDAVSCPAGHIKTAGEFWQAHYLGYGIIQDHDVLSIECGGIGMQPCS